MPFDIIKTGIYAEQGFFALLKEKKLTLKDVSERYGIPYVTLRTWSSMSEKTHRRAPKYVLDLIAYAIMSEE